VHVTVVATAAQVKPSPPPLTKTASPGRVTMTVGSDASGPALPAVTV